MHDGKKNLSKKGANCIYLNMLSFFCLERIVILQFSKLPYINNDNFKNLMSNFHVFQEYKFVQIKITNY